MESTWSPSTSEDGPQRDLVAREPLDVDAVALGDLVLLATGLDDGVHELPSMGPEYWRAGGTGR